MLTDQDCLADPHFVSRDRIRELGTVSELPSYRTMVRAIEPVEIEQHREEIESLLAACGKQRQYFIDFLWQREHRVFCIGNNWRTPRDRLVNEHYQSPFGLQARHWKMALQASAAIMSNYWRLTQKKALSEIQRRPWFAKLNRLEQRYVYRALGSLNEDFFSILDGKMPRVVEDAAQEKIASRKGLSQAIRRSVHSVMGRKPQHGDDLSVWFDSSCYTARASGKNVVVSLMTMTPRKRINLTVKGTVPVKSTIRLVQKSDGRFDLHVQKSMSASDIKPICSEQSKGELYCRAVDIGFTEVAVDDEGNSFGERLGAKITSYAEHLDRKLKERNKLYARAQKAGKAKRKRMLRCNLGKKKFDQKASRMRVEIKNIVNEAINRMLRQIPAQAYVLEDLSHRFVMDGKYSKEVRNMLSKWVRGTIKERLLFKTACAGVQVVFVPAAYSSQHCPECGYTSRDNRKGDQFQCQHCGYTAHADQNGARNLLMRAKDPEYKRYMNKDAIRVLERSRYEEWCRLRKVKPLSAATQSKKANKVNNAA